MFEICHWDFLLFLGSFQHFTWAVTCLSCPGTGRAIVKIGHSNLRPGSKELTSNVASYSCLIDMTVVVLIQCIKYILCRISAFLLLSNMLHNAIIKNIQKNYKVEKERENVISIPLTVVLVNLQWLSYLCTIVHANTKLLLNS